VVSGSAAQSDIENSEYPFIRWTPQRLKKYMEETGFRVKEFPFSEKLPVLRSVDPQTLERLKASYTKMIEWRLVPDKAPDEVDLNVPFAVESEVADGVFTVSIQGRMDTITAPELLKQFQDAGNGFKGIHVDVSRMAYVSSAGLRVLLMMYKSLENKENFEMTGVSEAVREILETTGFDQFFLR
jgi:anti-anti-sigma factor